MTFTESWRLLEDILVYPQANRSNIDSTEVTGSWVILFGNKQRSLLVPAENYKAQTKGLNFFITNPLRIIYARILLGLNKMFVRFRLLPKLNLPISLEEDLLEALPFKSPVEVAVLVGTSGPYQMASLLFMTKQGEGLGLAKVAMRPTADKSVETEARWLKKLGDYKKAEGMVPKLLTQGRLHNGREYLLTTLADNKQKINRFTQEHKEFLSMLGRMDLQVKEFSDAPVYSYLQRAFSNLNPHLEIADREMLNQALVDCEIRFIDWEGPFVVAQGDFAPWNIRYGNKRIFVFDWEYAEAGDNPLRDFFHFFLIQKAITGRPLSRKYIADLLDKAREFSIYSYPEWQWDKKIVSSHLLAYLLHLVLHYSESISHFDTSHPVIKVYNQLIVERKLWMQ